MTIVAAMLAMSSARIAAAQAALEPSGKWVVRGEDGMCLLVRSYGLGGTALQMGIRPLGSEERTEVVLVTARGGAGGGREARRRSSTMPPR